MKQAEAKQQKKKQQRSAKSKLRAEARKLFKKQTGRNKNYSEAGLSGAEKLMNDVETRVNENNEDLKTVVKN